MTFLSWLQKIHLHFILLSTHVNKLPQASAFSHCPVSSFHSIWENLHTFSASASFLLHFLNLTSYFKTLGHITFTDNLALNLIFPSRTVTALPFSPHANESILGKWRGTKSNHMFIWLSLLIQHFSRILSLPRHWIWRCKRTLHKSRSTAGRCDAPFCGHLL